jgi:class 3 adenylate cyclase
MAELEAITEIRPTKEKPHIVPAQFGRRFELSAGKSFTLGRDESKMDCAIPEDDQISRFYANLSWDGNKLSVERRGPVPPDFPEPPANKVVIRDPAARDKYVEVTQCVVAPGESFWIGQTQFTVRGDGECEMEAPVDATVAPRQEERTRAQLEEIPFTNPAAALKAMEQLPNTIRAATNEQGLFRQMLKVIMDAMPRADAAAIVRIPPDCPAGERRLATVESNLRPAGLLGMQGFTPSRRLAYRAILERRRSCLHCWSTDPRDSDGTEMTLANVQQTNVTPWAVCTPFQDGSKYALYVAGRASGQWSSQTKAAQDKIVTDLTQYQKIAELIVGMIETTLRMNRLARQNSLIRQAWPRELWPYMDDPTRLEAILQPKVKEVTILFCDLRNYSQFASRNSAELLPAWKTIAQALDAMSSTITDLGGVVSGFRGDAVLGFWGWPEPRDRQVERAAKAAVRIREKLTGWLVDRQCGLGVTHGDALAGRLGALDLAVVDLYGPIVNLTFRLEAMTKAFGVGIIVTQEVAEQVARYSRDGGARELQSRKLGNVRAKGFDAPIPAYELYSALSPSVNDWQLPDWEAAVDQFTQGKWQDAYDLLSQLFADDPAAQCLMRVMNETDLVPPPEWDGSFVPAAPGG